MILYIHFGIYKAGSSYIQYICANQRAYLQDKGIYFPTSDEDKKMKSGLISKGNADGLDAALKKENTKNINTTLKTWFEQAKSNNCEAVLISAEALVHQLAIQKRLDLLTSNAINLGFKAIKAMGFFRDLADHALSTYKHRAKSGKYPDYTHWVSEIYETPKLLNDLAQVIQNNQNIEWTLRRFQKNSDFLKLSFFKDWLGIQIPVFNEKPMVNESVSISEVKLLTHLKKAYPLVIGYFIDDLKALPKKEKAIDKIQDNTVFNSFVKKLENSKDSIEKINVFFQDKERLVVGDASKNKNDVESYVVLSEMQLNTITQRMHFFKTWKGKYVLLRRSIANLLLKK